MLCHGVVFEEILQAFGEAQLAARIEAGGAEGGDQGGHRGVSGMWGLEIKDAGVFSIQAAQQTFSA